MSDHAYILREFIEQPWDDPTVGNRQAAAALDALVAELDEAWRKLAFFVDGGQTITVGRDWLKNLEAEGGDAS